MCKIWEGFQWLERYGVHMLLGVEVCLFVTDVENMSVQYGDPCKRTPLCKDKAPIPS